MIVPCNVYRRRGSTLVESAVVYPLTFGLLLGIIVGALGVFRYQEMAALAREGSRYAAAHGSQWRKDAGSRYAWTHTQIVGSPGSGEIAANTSANPFTDGSLAYPVSPGSATTPASADDSKNKTWAQDVYDAAIHGKTFFLDTGNANFKVYVGWARLTAADGVTLVQVGGADVPDNAPGSRVSINVQYPVMPEWIWNIGTKSVSTAPMPITN